MMKIKNIFKQTNSMWVKYSDYQIRTVNNTEYILPAVGATLQYMTSLRIRLNWLLMPCNADKRLRITKTVMKK